MPLALNTKKTYKVILDSDSETVDNQPYFTYRYLTCEELDKVASIDDRIAEVKEDGSYKDITDIMCEAASMGLSDWAGMVDPITAKNIKFDPARLKSVVGIVEMRELIGAILAQTPTIDDKKKYESQSESDTEQSVKPVKV